MLTLSDGTVTTSLAFASTVLLALLSAVFVLRHWGLAALVAAAPLPGALVVACLPPATITLGLSLAIGWSVAFVLTHRFAVSAEDGTGGTQAGNLALSSNIRAAAAAAAVLLVPAAVEALAGTRDYLVAALGGTATIGFAFALITFIAPRLTYGEEFVTAANRSREWRARWFGRLLPSARRPFGLSMAGIAVVLAAIALSGARWPRVQPANWLLPISALVCVPISAYAVVRDWRRSLAVLVCVALPFLWGAWLLGRVGIAFSDPSFVVQFSAWVVAFVLQLCVGLGASGDPMTEDDVVAASERAIEMETLPMVVAGTVAIAAAGVSLWDTPLDWLCFGAIVVAAAVSGAAFQPAFVIVLEAMRPRRGTISARNRFR